MSAPEKLVCIHCGKPLTQHGRFARCDGGATQFDTGDRLATIRPREQNAAAKLVERAEYIGEDR